MGECGIDTESVNAARVSYTGKSTMEVTSSTTESTTTTTAVSITTTTKAIATTTEQTETTSTHPQLDAWEHIVAHVNSRNATWQAQVPSQFQSLAHASRLCGTRVPEDAADAPELADHVSDHVSDDEIPESFDARAAWPACAAVIGHVRDQSDCGSCWAFASTESFNDRLCIATGNTILLSVEDTTANCNRDQGCNAAGCKGGDLENPWLWFALK